MKNEITINFESLLKQNFGVIDARYRNYSVANENHKLIIVQVLGDRDSFYPDMIKELTGIELEKKKVMENWAKILAHKLEMSKLLDRDISIKVAALDFFE
ncbi:MAG: hypothetical protein U9N34_01645 [Candidatus Cloacimonadota bacterium]|nr:hypothetical protein [Candidatus Cloacimonadota bacterium]